MKRPLRPDELKLWASVAEGVRLRPGRLPPAPPADPSRPEPAAAAAVRTPAAKHPPHPGHRHAPAAPSPPDDIEPHRRRRLVRERDPIEARLDLHGMDYDRARAALDGFIRRQHAEGARAVLVITGKGTRGEGLLRRFAPEWLSAATLRPLVAGFSTADRRHGGEGALYVALKRRG